MRSIRMICARVLETGEVLVIKNIEDHLVYTEAGTLDDPDKQVSTDTKHVINLAMPMINCKEDKLYTLQFEIFAPRTMQVYVADNKLRNKLIEV